MATAPPQTELCAAFAAGARLDRSCHVRRRVARLRHVPLQITVQSHRHADTQTHTNHINLPSVEQGTHVSGALLRQTSGLFRRTVGLGEWFRGLGLLLRSLPFDTDFLLTQTNDVGSGDK
jgi:hypothetical protein